MRICRCVTKIKQNSFLSIEHSYPLVLIFRSPSWRISQETKKKKKKKKKENYQSRNLRIIARFHNDYHFSPFREVAEVTVFSQNLISLPRFRIVSTFFTRVNESRVTREQGRVARRRDKETNNTLEKRAKTNLRSTKCRITAEKTRVYH